VYSTQLQVFYQHFFSKMVPLVGPRMMLGFGTMSTVCCLYGGWL